MSRPFTAADMDAFHQSGRPYSSLQSKLKQRPGTTFSKSGLRSPSPMETKKLPNIPGIQRNPVGPATLQQTLGYSAQGYMLCDNPTNELRKTLQSSTSLGNLNNQNNQSLAMSRSTPALRNNRPATVSGGFCSPLDADRKQFDDFRSTSPSMSSTFYSTMKTSWEPSKEADDYHDLDGRYSITQQRKDREKPIVMKSAPLKTLPRYVVNDRKVLCFFAYYVEGVEDSNLETQRIRRVTLHYYMEDGTMDVHEGRQTNSGIPQGIMIHRHQVEKPRATPYDPHEYYTEEDIYVGKKIEIYSKVFTLVDCNQATKEFLLEKRGTEVQPIPYPDDQFGQHMQARTLRETGKDPEVSRNRRMHPMKYFMEARLGKPANRYDVQQFLGNEGRVLRFDAMWDDTSRLYGDILPFTVLYYLADDTIEVLQVKENNNGRAPFPKLLKRMKLPRSEGEAAALQYDEDYYSKNNSQQFYTWSDLRVGSTISVYGRDLLLVDADNFTREFFGQNGMPQRAKNAPFKQMPTRVPVQVPPYNGWGSEQDSLKNCELRVGQTQRPKRDPPVEEDQVVLRFSAKMRSKVSADRLREFVVMVYMSDGSVGVHEPPVVNSGILGGTFLKRMAVKKNQSDFYRPRDFYVGATLQLNTHKFDLYSADLYTIKYMEQYPEKFPKSNLDIITRKLRTARPRLQEALSQFQGGTLSENDFGAALLSAGVKLAKQEVLSLARAAAMDEKSSGVLSYDRLMSLL